MSAQQYTTEDEPVMPIAIIGMAGRYPGDAANPEKLWDLISSARSAMTEIPADRFNIDAFYHPYNERSGSINLRGGHYMSHTEVDAFDAPFFSITPNEALAMDPQQRMALECSYEAMENAGLRMEDLIGSDTSVYVGSFSKDYSEMLAADQENLPLYFGVGTGTAILSNRVSWFYDLKGPSISLDTACSSALVALHLGCQSLRTKESKMSIVGGVNSMLACGVMTAMTSLGFLSPDSVCHSFDEKANGYARGEGASFVVLKPLDAAIRDHDVIRGVIRNTGVNQDGNTPGITVPSAESQEALIRKCYQDAGLPLNETQYVEAHGTGTQAGDPQETAALSKTLGLSRPKGDPLLIGSIKTNIGHLEGASGLAQVTKAVFSLEKAELAPNLWYDKPNSRIPMDDWNLKVVDKFIPWPSAGPRRISINSFGYGGTNAHCIIDDAYHFLKARGLTANHNTVASSEVSSPASSVDSGIGLTPINDLQASILNLNGDSAPDYFHDSRYPTQPKLFVWSSNEQSGVDRTATMYREYLSKKLDGTKSAKAEAKLLDQLARTLASHRSVFPWKNWAVAASGKELVEALESPPVKAKRSTTKAPKLGFIFTGQGAQWYAMGRELRAYPIFEQSLRDADAHLKSIGCPWSLVEEFKADEIVSKINSPQFSQPICTALQVALIDLLASWGITPEAVAGHSSGEIAAAYAKGAITRESAWTISYRRGHLSESLRYIAPQLRGAMLATGLGANAVQPYIDALTEGYAMVACKNSLTSTTVSGDFVAIKALEIKLNNDGHFARMLKVETAYHSAHMEVIADLYLKSLKDIETLPTSGKVKMFSSVTGAMIENEDLGAAYWVKNMVNEVDFVSAVQSLCRHNPGKRRTTKPFVDVLLELGPHSALQGPLKQIIKAEGGKIAEVPTFSVLSRGTDAVVTSLGVVGSLFQLGYPVKIAEANRDEATLGKDGFLVDIPPFAWNRKNKYWGESQVSKNYRFRDHPRTDLLGAAIPQGNSIEPLFRNIMKLNEMPWVECHKVQGTILYPAAGMLVAAIEAAAQRASKDREVQGYELRDVIIGKAIVIPADDTGTETMLSLRPWRSGSQSLDSDWDEFRLMSRQLDSAEWILNCTGLVRVRYVSEKNPIFADEEKLATEDFRQRFDAIEAGCHKTVDPEAHYESLSTIGLNFSGPFKSLVGVKRGHFKSRCVLKIPDTKAMMPKNFEFPHVIHPSTLDCIIQMGLAGATPAEEELRVGLIPTSIENFYISKTIPSSAGELLHGVAAIENEGFEHAQGSFIVFDDTWTAPVVSFQGIKSTALRHGELGFAQAANMRKLIASFHWDEDISKMTSNSLISHCAESLNALPSVDPAIISDLEHAAFIYMRRVLETCSKDEVKTFQPHFQKFYQLMERTLKSVTDRTVPHQSQEIDWLNSTPEYEAELLKRVAAGSTDGAVMCEHGENLVAIMRGEILAIEVLMKNNHLNDFYQYGVGCPQTYAQLASYVDLLAHKNPTMKILEIGAGTGGATLPVLEAIGGQNGTSPRMSSYTFTDISTGFFDKAHEKFKSWLPWMTFAALDIERDPVTQNFKEGEYDLIVAANVLHATPSMDQTLSYVKKLLKPNGKLVLSEITNPLLRIHMIVGSFDGWWAGEKDGREWGPTMTESTWDEVLKRNAFSGVDLAMQDIQDPKDHFYSVMVSTAVAEVPTIPVQNHILFVQPEAPSQELRSFIDQSVAALKEKEGTVVDLCLLKDTAALELSKTSCIFALDCDSDNALLPTVNKVDFECLKNLILKSANSTWITRGATINSESPKNNLMTGMARCIRAENPSVALLTVDMDFNSPLDSSNSVEKFCEVYHSGLQAGSEVRPDWEYAIRDGKILIQRILLEKGMNDLLSSFHVQPKPELAPFKQPGRPLALQVETAGRLDSLQFGDDPQYETPLAPDTVEIEVKAVGLNFKDIMIAMGQLEEHALGLDCSGVVSRVGSDVTKFKIGDRVMTWTVGAFCNYTRSPESMCVTIPEAFSFGTAASMPLIFSTAWFAISNTANLKKGESILIHSAAGGVGQAAIMLSKHIGAEIFATVSSDAKKKLIMENYGIPEDHIFNSRDDSFVSGIMRLTNKKGVDVVLNSLAGDLLRKTWHCTSWFGRFVEMGQKDIESNTGLDMSPFLRNISFHSVNLVALLQRATPICAKVFQEVMGLLSEGIVAPVDPMTFMPFSKIEEGFRTMQIGKHVGKIVFEAHDEDLVPVVPPKYKWMKFQPDVTYVLSGGLGGLGRSLAQWMIRQGAKNIVFLSRSGDKKPEARAVLDALAKEGARVRAFACDVSDPEEVKKVVAECEKNFPPIKGCIQGAMVLKDSIYENMTHEQYLGAVLPKVQGSWNLHEYLPKDMDFYVMLSSSAGIAGSRGQGNYAAGNSFQDALANYRRGLGLNAGVIDLGMILDVGYVAETSNKEVAENTKKWSFAGLREKEVHALVQSVIEGQSAPGQKIPAQLITGLGTGGMANLAGFKIPWWFEDAKFAHIKDVDTHQVTMETEEDTMQLQILLAQATSMEAACDIVSMALLRKLAKSLMVDVEDIESTRPINRYGVDSLLAVEIRSWIFTEIQADISVFQLLSNVPISQLVRTMVEKSKCVPAAVLAEAA